MNPRRRTSTFVERLERRTLMAADPPVLLRDLPWADFVHDPERDVLYVTSGSAVQRYDPRAAALLDSWAVGQSLGGADITPDGRWLFAADRAVAGGQGIIRKVDLETGAVSNITYDLGDTPVPAADVVIVSETKALLDPPHDPYNPTAQPRLRELDLASGEVTERPEALSGRFAAHRSADRGTVLFMYETGTTAAVYDTASDTLGPFTSIFDVRHPDGAGVAVSPDGSLVAAGGRVFNRSLELVRTLPDVGTTLAFHPTQPWLYVQTGNDYGQRLTVDTTTWEERERQYMPLTNDYGRPLAVRQGWVAANGNHLFYGLQGVGAVRLVARPEFTGLPDVLGVGRSYELTISGMDGRGVTRSAYAGTVRFTSDDPAAVLPPETAIDLAAGGTLKLSVTFNTPGEHTLVMTDVATGLFDADAGYGPLVTVDGSGPQMEMTGSRPPGSPHEPYTIYIHTTDENGLDNDLLATGENQFVAVGPDGVTHTLRQVPSGSGGGSAREISVILGHPYALHPPGGSWNGADTGRYLIRALPGAMRDRVGNPSAAADLGEIRFATAGAGGPWTGNESGGHDLAVAVAQETVPDGGIVTGARLRASVSVSNQGDLAARGSSRLTVAVVPDGGTVGGPGSRELYAGVQRVNLRPGGSRQLRLRLTIPADLPEGSYRLAAELEPFNGQVGVEPSDDNNAATSVPFHVTSVATPDVIGAEFEDLTPGARLRVPVTLLNRGSGPAAGRFLLKLIATPASSGSEAGAVELGTYTTSLRLKSGAERTVRLQFTVPDSLPAGSYLLRIESDPL